MTGKNKSLMRCLGEFAGHIAKAIRSTPPPETTKTQVRQETEETRQGDVVLRRTIIEEVEMPADTVGEDEQQCS